MTKAELLAILYERLNYQTTPATAVTTRLGNLLNEVQRSILRRPGISKLRDTSTGLTFASAANVASPSFEFTAGSLRGS